MIFSQKKNKLFQKVEEFKSFPPSKYQSRNKQKGTLSKILARVVNSCSHLEASDEKREIVVLISKHDTLYDI